MMRSVHISFAASTPINPTAPSPTTATADPGRTLAASAGEKALAWRNADDRGVPARAENIRGRQEMWNEIVWKPDHVSRFHLFDLPAFALNPTCASDNDQGLAERMRVPGRACARLESN